MKRNSSKRNNSYTRLSTATCASSTISSATTRHGPTTRSKSSSDRMEVQAITRGRCLTRTRIKSNRKTAAMVKAAIRIAASRRSPRGRSMGSLRDRSKSPAPFPACKTFRSRSTAARRTMKISRRRASPRAVSTLTTHQSPTHRNRRRWGTPSPTSTCRACIRIARQRRSW